MSNEKNNQVATTPKSTELAKTRTMPQCKILERLRTNGEGSFLELVARKTGDRTFAQSFVTDAEVCIANAWRLENGKWVNDFNLVPPQKILEALWEGARNKISPDRHNATLVVYKGKNPTVKLLPDFKGLCNCAICEGICLDIGAVEVCRNDEIEVEFGEVTRHRIDVKQPRGEIIGAVAWAILPSGRRKTCWMTLEELEQVRACSQTNEVWGTWTVEMYKKTVIRRMFKTMRNSPKLNALCELDNKDFDMSKARPVRSTSPIRSVTRSHVVTTDKPAEIENLPEAEHSVEGVLVEGVDGSGDVF